jgi:hypothetical protein
VDHRTHATSDPAWQCRLFNVAMRFGAVRLMVAYDSFRNKNVQPEDQTAQGYAHVDILRFIKVSTACSEAPSLAPSLAPL